MALYHFKLCLSSADQLNECIRQIIGFGGYIHFRYRIDQFCTLSMTVRIDWTRSLDYKRATECINAIAVVAGIQWAYSISTIYSIACMICLMSTKKTPH